MRLLHWQLEDAVGLLQDQLTDAVGVQDGAWAHEPEVPDLHESRGEDMLEEAPNELHDVEVDRSVTCASVLSMLEGNDAIFDFDDPAVGDGHFEDIRGKILQRSGAISNGLTVYDPVGFPDLCLELRKETGLIHLFFELCAEDRRKGLDGDIEIGS